ncbi:MAG: FAD-dependent oxidoreductase [Candidatus Eisenbacteria bacterium]|uniref:Ion-translocating oxidoreductase complex subunit B n=1 Tax=Eiseniibacteriota bacterium TaxID=2212470 RepID=A0A948RU16_UNCEI|nr:FAD-dependent oxidoreductase [Candidatus Eisenbacteria bacterium]MBU1951262.1 FAD-dependent oxidoreductase [Candidatus Eisenbacteria bacterium]MBU2691008.1 FAD-dependent oxidoreductase [Candidatus Eisenbacteria bacterium]
MFVAACVIGGIGFLAALGLGVAARFFAVHVDPKVLEIEEALPGANCGGCGFSGCSAAALAVAKGKAGPDLCVAGGIEVAEAVAEILGLSVEAGEVGIAELGCKYGMDDAHLRFDYAGVPDCRAAALVGGGGKICTMGCLGLGTCVNACPFGALVMGEDGLPHVIAEKCTACGTCERVCPKGIIRVQTPSRRFTHVQTEDDCVAPCQATCPAQIDIPDYIAAIGRGEFLEAVRIIKEANPFPLVCGRVCPHPCEAACRRGEVDEAININHLKRFAADFEMTSGQHVLPQVLSDTGKRVAIIGGGPSGLTCAYYLARLGHKVKVFEAMPEPGGMLLYGIPEYRLPKKTLAWEIDGILQLGVELECNTKMGKDFTLDDLINQGFDSVYIAVGAWDSRRLGVPGEHDFEEVASGTEFLIKRGLREDTPIGKNVMIVGGGNTAMDAARTSWRLGAENVYLLYRRSRKEMPANDIEVAEGEHEEIKYHFLAAPTKLVGEGGRLKALEFQKMELGEPDASGRRRPVPVEGSEMEIEVDNVFSAIGQSPNLDCLDAGDLAKMIERTRWNSIDAKEGTMQTALKQVFAGGDDWRGAATAVEAIRDGRFAARSIHMSLMGEEMELPSNWYRKAPNLPGIDRGVSFERGARVKMPELSVDERRLNFNEVELGLTEEMARKESRRCLQCGLICYQGYRKSFP